MDRLTNLLGAFALAVGDRVAAATEGAVGAGGAAAAVLVHLHHHPGRSVSDLAAVVGVGGSGGVRLVDRLEGQGLVTRGSSPTDRRNVLLRLTDEGAETARRGPRGPGGGGREGGAGSGGVRLVDRLEGQGLVTRGSSPTDRRNVLLRLTDEGAETARRVLRAREDAVRQVVQALGKDQRAVLEHLLPDLITALASSRTEVLHTCRLCDVTACRQAPGCPFDCMPRDDGGPA